jgi:hypothetical protein
MPFTGEIMKKSILTIAIGLAVATLASADDIATRVDASRAATKEFSATLQGELQAGMKAGGPTQAIDVCNKRAGKIAAEVSKMHGWQVGRTSLRYRNPKNAPDAWERATLARFEEQKAAGADPAKLEAYTVVTEGGKREFRYMKAIPTAPLCVTCHGAQLDPAVSAKLKVLYPNDLATGFKPGDIRGAFTIRQPMP